MTKEQEELCLGNMRLVSHCSKKFASSGIPWDDLCACGNLGLVRAAATFSPEKGTRFSTYACRCIDNEIYLLLRQRKKHSKVSESLDSERANTDGVRLHDVLPDDTDMVEAVEQKLLVADILSKVAKLPKRKRRVLELYLGLTGEPPMTQQEIATQMGCSRSLIHRIFKEGINQIKREAI